MKAVEKFYSVQESALLLSLGDKTVVAKLKAGDFGLAVVKNRALFSVDPDGAHYQSIRGDADLPAGEWIHLVGTYDNATFRLYVNGLPVKSAACGTPFQFADENPIIIGGNTNTQGRKWVDCFHGRIDEVRLYDRALSAEAVLGLANLGASGAHPE